MAEAFHALPLAGGLFDQPAGYMLRMEAVLRATAEQDQVSDNRDRAKEELREKLEENGTRR